MTRISTSMERYRYLYDIIVKAGNEFKILILLETTTINNLEIHHAKIGNYYQFSLNN